MAPSPGSVLIPLPSYGFDPSEAAIPWRLMSDADIPCVFATPDGRPAEGDRRMLTGEGLGILSPVLRAREDARRAYDELVQSPEFQAPLSYADAEGGTWAGLLLPGGHDKGVKVYLESEVLQGIVAAAFGAGIPVGAICHGVVLAARSQDADGRSVLHGRKTTCLLESQEMLAYTLTRLWLGDYYLTYPGLTVEAEVRAALASPGDFRAGPTPLMRDDPEHLGRGFVVEDGQYVSARWPGDAYGFAGAFIGRVLGEGGA